MIHKVKAIQIGDVHDDFMYVGPRLLMISLNYPSHRKCIGFDDFQVGFFAIEPAHCCMEL